jgi:glutamate formiminotransferase/formiminotetrahydrofolate cyclodeaminase
MKLVECVPNFSEGRDQNKIRAITTAIESVEGITLLDVDPGRDTNRTVVTFVGAPEVVGEAAFRAIQTAAEVIDMRTHHGAHARMGATDVCPFIPIAGLSIDECVALAKQVGDRVGQELNIPVYLYEYAATREDRRNLAVIRQGEYEGLAKKLADSHWKPDFGPAKMNVRAGATVIGVRDFLIAYNINLNTRDKRLATDIAFELREKGRSLRIPNPESPNLLDGEIVRYQKGFYPCAFCDQVMGSVEEIVSHNREAHHHDLEAVWKENGYDPSRLIGKAVKKPGKFKNVKAVGWYIDTFKRAQISINFTNYKVTPIHEVFDEACRLAEERGIRVTGSELVGLIPLEALIMAGKYYLKKQGRTPGIPEADILETAIQTLGLNDVAPFNPEEKIIEYAVGFGQSGPLVSRTIDAFVAELSSNSPAPGGGSVSALAGSLAAALTSMVAALTHEKKGFRSFQTEMEEIGTEAQKLKDRLLALVDEDTQAFNRVMEANRLPAGSNEEKKRKQQEIQIANRSAVEVPLEVVSTSLKIFDLVDQLVEHGNPNSLSDAGVAAEVALAAVRGAAMNVLINLPSIESKKYRKEKESAVREYVSRAEAKHKIVYQKTMERLEK